jgi:DNA-binding HxlR family transcriptional regulator
MLTFQCSQTLPRSDAGPIAGAVAPAYIGRMNTNPNRRSDCPINYALEHFGDRWTLLVIRDMLFFGKTHYGDFLSGEEGISTNILASRLRKMEADGLIRSRPDGDARRQLYCLTEKGIDLARIMVEINRWSGENDPDTGVPAAYRERMMTDFEGLVEEYRQAARATASGGSARGADT